MKWLAIGIGIFLIFLFLLLLSKISLKVTFLYSEMEKQCLFQVKIWKVKYTFDVLERIEKQQKKTGQKIEKAEREGGIENKIMAQLDSIGELIKKLQQIHTIVKDFFKKVKINGWKWHSQIGAGDAASTGIVTGYAWGTKGMIAGVIGQYMHIVDIPDFEITPVFQGKGFASRCELTASFHLYRAVITGIKLLIFMRKQRSSVTEKSIQA
ncbi:DUF2953 domain-containing protein [Bacillus cytotoxicus]|uniref:DUF2953 domain-containing protein n=1 Tax=Bacillus cytotoxicus (strain DSM 22905 / CIP 110041 / 391-98 / NVH 391-98) TaxID=315749 RepID=A7GTS3_BACCN|nr:DUF2953 domain-containing protein [Bacillus cytotoxicus]ABS23531.1 conserved hypothetical protein [Bacillus cytotoxicus NVH 391-98]AWC46151.1 DUF2953 domain-containing protein [Bacillus cytotoxicus]MDH2864593.1 DUF2953 domain-containing protein [Bacillus cytotoxicus]MDH2883778.1 DUF2953 domain-containing protein [Bacillus cytotoxicus]NZD33213.1 DUF2953 domain-containing protein [Bacillus cytotoxicus]